MKADFIDGFVRMCANGCALGWHERNGGNLSYRIVPRELEAIKAALSGAYPWVPLEVAVPGLAGEHFLVTGSGRYLSNVSREPSKNIGIIEIGGDGLEYRIRWGLENGGRPTSELPTHLTNHEVKKTVSNGTHRVVYHCHATNVIALSFVLPLNDRDFTRELWETATECPVVFPDGVGVVEWMVPGGRDIAAATARLMARYDVAVWAHHGLFVSGESFDTAFGLAHTVEKAAEIAVKIRAMGGRKQSIDTDGLRKLAAEFGVSLTEEFL